MFRAGRGETLGWKWKGMGEKMDEREKDRRKAGGEEKKQR